MELAPSFGNGFEPDPDAAWKAMFFFIFFFAVHMNESWGNIVEFVKECDNNRELGLMLMMPSDHSAF